VRIAYNERNIISIKYTLRIGYSIPGHSTCIWKRMHWGEAELHSFSYTNDQVLYNQFSPYFLCRVSWLPIITNLGNLSQIRLNEYQLKSISFNYNICDIWKIFNNTRQRKYGLTWRTVNISFRHDLSCLLQWSIKREITLPVNNKLCLRL
jgi:hypothetical protein